MKTFRTVSQQQQAPADPSQAPSQDASNLRANAIDEQKNTMAKGSEADAYLLDG